MRSRGQRRKGRSRLSRAWAEERPGRMRHGSWGRAHGWASVPPTASQTIAASSVDAAWGSGHHHETRMRGTGSVPPQHATSCHAVACGPRRRRTTCACHTRGRTHTKIYDRGYQLMYKKYRQILYNCTRLHLPTSRARPRSQRTPGSCLRLVSPPAWTAKAVVGGLGHPPGKRRGDLPTYLQHRIMM